MIKKYVSLLSAFLMCLALPSCESKSDITVSVSENSASDEFIQPDENADDYSLGSYQIAPSGVKYYYDPDVVSRDILEKLEEYFTAYQNNDFEAYKACLFPGYAEHMEEYLQRDYNYGLDNSFNTQCSNLEGNAGGKFRISRLRVFDPSLEQTEEGQKELTPVNQEEFFSMYDELFNVDYYSEVTENSDKISNYYFAVMVDTGDSETLLLSDYEIAFAEKDGILYTFG